MKVGIIGLGVGFRHLQAFQSHSDCEEIFVTDFSKKQKQEVLDIIRKSEDHESNSNQILEYTKSVKKMDLKLKTLIVKTLWKIVLSDEKSGQYESNLMRRICGLLYLPDKLSGEIKLSILEEKKL